MCSQNVSKEMLNQHNLIYLLFIYVLTFRILHSAEASPKKGSGGAKTSLENFLGTKYKNLGCIDV